MVATDGACGSDEPSDTGLPEMMRALGPLATAAGGTVLIEQVSGTLSGAAVVAVPDVASVWAWLARRFPLGPLPPKKAHLWKPCWAAWSLRPTVRGSLPLKSILATIS